MAPSADRVLLIDTSVAVALSVADHAHHEQTSAALRDRRLGLAGHAAFETFSVLTRLPAPARRSPATIAHLLSTSFPHTVHLRAEDATGLMARLNDGEIAGGSVYDALVAFAAVRHELELVTRDRRALSTYRALDASVRVLGD